MFVSSGGATCFIFLFVLWFFCGRELPGGAGGASEKAAAVVIAFGSVCQDSKVSLLLVLTEFKCVSAFSTYCIHMSLLLILTKFKCVSTFSCIHTCLCS